MPKLNQISHVLIAGTIRGKESQVHLLRRGLPGFAENVAVAGVFPLGMSETLRSHWVEVRA